MDEFRTSDMALVSYLKIRGYHPDRVEWVDGTCYWFFVGASNKEFAGDVGMFNMECASVEPVAFNRVFSQTKREFFDSKPAVPA